MLFRHAAAAADVTADIDAIILIFAAAACLRDYAYARPPLLFSLR